MWYTYAQTRNFCLLLNLMDDKPPQPDLFFVRLLLSARFSKNRNQIEYPKPDFECVGIEKPGLFAYPLFFFPHNPQELL